MRAWIAIAVIVSVGCVQQPQRVAIWTEAEAVALQAHMIDQSTKLDQSIDLSAETVNAITCLTDEIKAIKATVEKIQNAPRQEPTQAVLPATETVTADEVRQIIAEALESVACKCQPPDAVVKQPAKPEPVTVAPSPFQMTPVSSVTCSGGVCQPVRTYVPQQRQRFLRIFK